MNPNEVVPIYKPDVDGYTGGYLQLRFPQGEDLVTFRDEESSRAYDFSRETGKLTGIEFLDPLGIDLTALPQDDIVPHEVELVELFRSGGILPAQLITVYES